jgi:phosphorylase kinase alpha/beta subunit
MTDNLYKSGETKQFENIECDWPVFCCFLIIDGMFKSFDDQVKEYQELLFSKLLRRDQTYGDYLIPKYFYVSLLIILNFQ